MSENALIQWLQQWVAETTGVESVDATTPFESYGLSSRDAVVLSGELEKLLGRRIDPTVAYQYPTIAALAHALTADAPAASNVVATGRDVEAKGHDIAIVGTAGRFPGANNVDEYWELLAAGEVTTGPLPEGRWSEYNSDPFLRTKMREEATDGGYLDDIAAFDNEFFGLSPLEAKNIDPQQRIMLEVAWEALEDAHIPADSLRGQRVGVFVGSSNNDYGMLMGADPAQAHPYALTGASSAVIPNRISYAFDFRGPSMNVDTACSSSLVSVHHAVRALREGEADVALAGGVNILANPFASLMFSELGVISPSGKIHAFSDDADGIVRSEAAGFIVLKRVEDAIADGDDILAVIKGSATNSDGHSNGLTAPNPEAQVDVLQQAYADAGVDPRTVDLVEAHGTGTILGDPIEATALGQVCGTGREAGQPLLLGSAKSNIGHSESAAGVAALIKVVQALQRDTIPAMANFAGPNRYVDFDANNLEVVEDPREWPQYSGQRVAGVSGFGFGGTNAHVVVKEFDPADYEAAPQRPEALTGVSTAALPVSGLLTSRRKTAAAGLADALEGRPDADLIPFARSLALRNHGRSAAVVTAATTEEAVKRLRQVAEGKVGPGIAVADSPNALGPVFVYSGFGSQHRKMAKQLMASSPLFAQRMRELDSIVQFEAGWSIIEIIEDDGLTYDTETGQVAVTAYQIALTDMLDAAGIRPAAVMGMSMGEIAAGYASGGISAKDAMVIACHRARLMGEGEALTADTDDEGAMAVVELSADQLEGTGVEAAVFAGPGMLTVGGPVGAVKGLVEKLEEEGKFARLMRVRGAGHTSALDPILGDLAAQIAGIEAHPLRIPLLSSVDERVVYQPGQVVHTDEYFLRMTRQPVYIQQATETAFAEGYTTLVEVAPNPVAIMGLMNTAFASGKPDAQLLFTCKRKVDEVESILDLAAKLYVTGTAVDFTAFYGRGPRIDAPLTQFKRSEFWTDARPASAHTSLLGAKVRLPEGQVAYSTAADTLFSPHQIIDAVAAEVLPGSRVVAYEDHDVLPAEGDVTTIAATSLGGVSVKVFHEDTLLAEGFATALNLGGAVEEDSTAAAPAPAAEVAGDAAPVADELADVDAIRWDPNSGESVAQRLRSIVSESMGYDAEDLPDELPLIDLGLDSLMGMRIKNRVENDFQIPPLPVQTLRDASVADVIRIVEDAVTGVQSEAAEAAAEPAEPADAAAAEPAEKPEGAQGVGVAPRDASERMVFGAWAKFTGTAAAGVTSELPAIDDAQAEAIANHLSERSGITVTAEQVKDAETLEPLADIVREGLETEVEGNIRVLQQPEHTTKPPVFVFHPAGGSSAVYQPLARRLADDVAVYGVERLEGTLEERAAAYVEDINRIAPEGKVVLAGWSFGGALAYEVAHQLGNDRIAYIALLDTTQPSEPAPDTPEEAKARWERYAKFAKDTYGLDFPVPFDLLETAGEDAVLNMLAEFLATTDASEHGLAAGVLEHQRASFVDNQILNRLDFARWADVQVPVLLFRAERMHDGAITLEPAYAHIDEDGGWGAIVKDLTIVHLPGDHLAVVDEPAVGIVGKYMNEWIDNGN